MRFVLKAPATSLETLGWHTGQPLALVKEKFMRNPAPFALLLTICLFSPVAGVLERAPVAQAQPHAVRRTEDKMTADLRMRIRQARRGSGERARVIINVAGSAAASEARHALQHVGAQIHQQLDALGIIVDTAGKFPPSTFKQLSEREMVIVGSLLADDPVTTHLIAPR